MRVRHGVCSGCLFLLSDRSEIIHFQLKYVLVLDFSWNDPPFPLPDTCLVDFSGLLVNWQKFSSRVVSCLVQTSVLK